MENSTINGHFQQLCYINYQRVSQRFGAKKMPFFPSNAQGPTGLIWTQKQHTSGHFFCRPVKGKPLKQSTHVHINPFFFNAYYIPCICIYIFFYAAQSLSSSFPFATSQNFIANLGYRPKNTHQFIAGYQYIP